MMETPKSVRDFTRVGNENALSINSKTSVSGASKPDERKQVYTQDHFMQIAVFDNGKLTTFQDTEIMKDDFLDLHSQRSSSIFHENSIDNANADIKELNNNADLLKLISNAECQEVKAPTVVSSSQGTLNMISLESEGTIPLCHTVSASSKDMEKESGHFVEEVRGVVEKDSRGSNGTLMLGLPSVTEAETNHILQSGDVGVLTPISDLPNGTTCNIDQKPFFHEYVQGVNDVSDSLDAHTDLRTNKLWETMDVDVVEPSLDNPDLSNDIADEIDQHPVFHDFSNEADDSFDDSRKWEVALTMSPSPVVVPDTLEDWHCFDVDESPVDVTVNQYCELEPWEQLLEDGFEDTVKENGAPLPSNIILLPLEQENLGYTSPANPFVDGLGRSSNFSDAEGFAHGSSENLPLPQQSSDLLSAEECSDEKERVLSGDNLVMGTVSELQTEQNHQPLADQSSTSELNVAEKLAETAESFEPPSFMSLVDPESHALFEASMPTYHKTKSTLPNQGEEAWVADFSLIVPPTQIISRSSSLPGAHMGPAATEGPSTNAERLTPTASPKTRGSLLMSPRLSPVVKNMVNKVRAVSGAGNDPFSTVREATAPRVEHDTSKAKSRWGRCLC